MRFQTQRHKTYKCTPAKVMTQCIDSSNYHLNSITLPTYAISPKIPFTTMLLAGLFYALRLNHAAEGHNHFAYRGNSFVPCRQAIFSLSCFCVVLFLWYPDVGVYNSRQSCVVLGSKGGQYDIDHMIIIDWAKYMVFVPNGSGGITIASTLL